MKFIGYSECKSEKTRQWQYTMKMQNINSKTMKAANARMVLNTIRRDNQISRKALGEKTGLTMGTITNLTQSLMAKHYIVESGSGESMGGRRPVFLEINANAGYVVGLELEASGLTCVLSDFKGKILVDRYESICRVDDKEKIIAQMASLFERSVQAAGVSHDAILGLGLAIPGPCDYKNGILLNPPNFPGLVNVPLRQILSERLGVPVYASKETSCAVLSEHWFGNCAGHKRLFGVTVGRRGIGGALVLNGDIFQESEGESMDIGHTIVQLDGRPCPCGSFGCLEVHASGEAACLYAQERSGREWSFEELAAGAAQGQEACVEAVKTCAFYISVALGNVVSLLSPQSIFLGGEFMEACPLLFQKTVEYMERRSYPAGVRSANKCGFTYKNLSGAVGGLSLVFDAMSRTIL